MRGANGRDLGQTAGANGCPCDMDSQFRTVITAAEEIRDVCEGGIDNDSSAVLRSGSRPSRLRARVAAWKVQETRVVVTLLSPAVSDID